MSEVFRVASEFDLGIDGLSDYQEIGSGGFATVYSALEVELDRRVAVKVLDAVDDSGRRRFDRERLTMGRTSDHPNIVTPLRSGYTRPDGKPYLVMEYLAGGSLQDHLETEGPLPWQQAIELILAVARALEFSHNSGVFHKDVKPANILVSRTGVVKLTDFGIAAIRESTATSQVAFSMLYTAPETFNAGRDPNSQELIDPRDDRSDLYSLAATLYTLGTGSPPFESSSSAGLMHQILTEPTPILNNRGLDEFFAIAMAKEPENRYQTAAQFIAELQTRTQTSPATVAVPAHQMISTGTRRRVRPSVAAIAALGVLLIIGLISLGIEGTTNKSESVAVYANHTTTVWGLTELSDGRIASSGDDATVQIWHPANTDLALITYTGHTFGVNSITELSDGRIASGSDDNTVQIWDPDDPDTTPITYANHSDLVRMVVKLVDGRIASSSSDGTVQIWGPADPDKTLVAYTGHTSEVWAVVELSDGRIASAGLDSTVQIWDPDDPDTTIATYTGHTNELRAVVELSDGRIASAGLDSTVQIWDPLEPDMTLVSYMGHSNGIWAVVELSDGRIASAGLDSTVQIWDPDDPDTTIATYTGHTNELRAVVELSDGRIASAGLDSTVQIWDPDDI